MSRLKAKLHRLSPISSEEPPSFLPRTHHTLTVIGNKAYIFGGEDPRTPGRLLDNHMHVLELPLSSSSSSSSPIQYKYHSIPARGPEVPLPRKAHSAAALGDRIFIFGGLGAGGGEKDAKPQPLEENGRIWIFDTTSETWGVLDPFPGTPFPPARSGHASVVLDKPVPGKLAAFEVQDEDDQEEEIQKKIGSLGLDTPETGENEPDHDPKDYGTLFIHAGLASSSASSTSTSAWSRFHSAFLSPSSAATAPTPESSTSHGGKGGPQYLNDTWAFDIPSRTWKTYPPAPTPPLNPSHESSPHESPSPPSLTHSGSYIYRYSPFSSPNPIPDAKIDSPASKSTLDILEVNVATFSDTFGRHREISLTPSIGEWLSIPLSDQLFPPPSTSTPTTAATTSSAPTTNAHLHVITTAATTHSGEIEYLLLLSSSASDSTSGFDAGNGAERAIDIKALALPPPELEASFGFNFSNLGTQPGGRGTSTDATPEQKAIENEGSKEEEEEEKSRWTTVPFEAEEAGKGDGIENQWNHLSTAALGEWDPSAVLVLDTGGSGKDRTGQGWIVRVVRE